MSLGEEKINSSEHHVGYGSLGPIYQEDFKVYKQRWYILLMFSVCSAVNAVKWNTWSPIQGTSQVVFGWSDTTITLLVAWGPIVYVLVFLPMSWLMDVKGEKNTYFQYYHFFLYHCFDLERTFKESYLPKFSESSFYQIA